MKKFFKFLGTVAAIGAGVAGGLFLYNKYQEKKDAEAGDFDEDYDDDFSDGDGNEDTRSYVNINAADKAADEEKKDENDEKTEE